MQLLSLDKVVGCRRYCPDRVRSCRRRRCCCGGCCARPVFLSVEITFVVAVAVFVVVIMVVLAVCSL